MIADTPLIGDPNPPAAHEIRERVIKELPEESRDISSPALVGISTYAPQRALEVGNEQNSNARCWCCESESDSFCSPPRPPRPPLRLLRASSPLRQPSRSQRVLRGFHRPLRQVLRAGEGGGAASAPSSVSSESSPLSVAALS